MNCASDKDIPKAIFKNGSQYVAILPKHKWKTFQTKREAEHFIKKEITNKCIELKKKVNMY